MQKNESSQDKHSYPPVFYSVWQDAWIAMTKPRQYLQWAFQPFSRSVKYLLILSAVMSIVGTVYYYINLKPVILDVQAWARESLPMITYENNELKIVDDQSFSVTDSDEFFFKVDVTQSKADEPVIDSFYNNGFLFTKDALIVSASGKTDVISYSEFDIGPFQLDGLILAVWIDKYILNIAFYIIPLLGFIYVVCAKLCFAACFAFLYYMFNGFRYNFVHLWSMAIYAITPAIVAGYISFVFYPVWGIYTMVFLFYMSFAMMYYRHFFMMKNSKQVLDTKD